MKTILQTTNALCGMLLMFLFAGAQDTSAGSYINNLSSSAGAATITGNATFTGGQLQLTPFSPSTYGTLLVTNLDPGLPINGFTAVFSLTLTGNGIGDAADGFSFNFANPTNYPAGYYSWETGASNGLSFCIVTYLTNYVAVKYNGTVLAQWNSSNAVLTDGAQQTVSISYSTLGGASLTYRGQTLTVTPAQLAAAGYAGPHSGDQFLFGARCGSLQEAASLANVSLTTEITGTWTALAHPPPGQVGMMLLLSDGTVMASHSNPGLTTNVWYRFKPDIHGSYLNGTWTNFNVPATIYNHNVFGSCVLRDGRLMVIGGEYGNGGAKAEIYNPTNNTWTDVSPPASLLDPNQLAPGFTQNQSFLDCNSKILATGEVLIAPVAGKVFGGTLIYNPAANSWSAGPESYTGNYFDESSWIKLPDDSILMIDLLYGGTGTNSERYIPAYSTWVNDGNVPVTLWDPYGYEIGPACLLPNGNAFFIGSTPTTAIYAPSGTPNPGNWIAGPPIPNGQGAPDAPLAMMVNGKILCALSPTPTSSEHAPAPTAWYEYDYSAGTVGAFTPVVTPWGGVNVYDDSQANVMLDLPDGNVLMCTYDSPNLYLYTPHGAPLATGKPVVQGLSLNGDGSLHLTGTLFNGISEGASFGDENQMDSNYPLVRFTDASGNVRYGRSYNWSRTSVMTGTNVVTTECAVPAGASLHDTIQVVANGIASDGTIYFPLVTTLSDSGGGSLRQVLSNAFPGTTVTFSNNLSGGTITLTSGQLVLNQNVSIDASALACGITLNGNHNGRVVEVSSGTSVLTSLTISNGYNTIGYGGGGVENYGNLTLNNCRLVGNQSPSTGGAIASYFGSLTLNNTLVAGNSCGNVSGLYVQDEPATLNGCTINSNTGSDALRLQAAGGNSSLTAVNCTFSGNVAPSGVAAAISVFTSAGLTSAATLYNCTVASNSVTQAGQPGAIYLPTTANGTNALTLYNTIVSGNSSGGAASDITGTAVAGSFNNLIGTGGGLVNGVNGNKVGVTNPQLAALGNYGGLTQTMPPLPGSPAIDAASNAYATGLATDQRGAGYLRVMNAYADIGAVEALVPSIPNASFEATTFLIGVGYASQNGGIIEGWTISDTTHIGQNPASSSPFANNGAIPAGSTVAFIQSVGATESLSTTISGLTPGVSYLVGFRANMRSGYGTPGATWSLNGGAFVPFTCSPAVGGTSPYYNNTGVFTATGTTAALVIYNTTVADSALLLDAFTIAPLQVVVTTTNDSGPGSLRQAVASVGPGGTITFTNNLSGANLLLTGGELLLNKNLAIDGSALPGGIKLNGGHTNRIFEIAGGSTNVLIALTLTNGYPGAGNFGGAIYNAGTLSLTNCTLAGNSVDSSAVAGAINNLGPLTLTGCTLSGNASGQGGAINNDGATCALLNCTFAGNTSAGNGGAIDNTFGSKLSAVHCSFSGNTASGAGGGIDNYLSVVNLTNTIVAGNGSQDIYNWTGSTNTAGGSNIVQVLSNAGTLVGGSTILAVNPLLGPLANNGGPTLTLLPRIGSPAIDAGVTSADAGLTTDQRGLPRLVGDAVDLGAVEASIVPFVFKNTDSGYGSLRYAVTYATNNATVTFSNILSGQTILLTSGVIALNNSVTIDASALNSRVQINGNLSSQAFSVGGGVNAVLNFLTVTNCYSTGFGGGILSFGNLTLDNCQLVNNQSTGTGGALAAGFGSLTLNQTTVSGNTGGNCSAIYIQDQPITLVGCTINGNSGAQGDAVRLHASAVNSALTAINSTIAGNTVSGGFASAITLQSGAGLSASATLTNCTVAGNSASLGGQPGAIYLQPGGGLNTVGLYNCVVSGNTSGGVETDITGTANADSAYNLIGAGGGLVNGVNGNQIGVNNPLLSALGNYGGALQTMPPLVGSPAVDAGSDLVTSFLAVDERGLPRKSGAHVDIGAAELQIIIASNPAVVTGLNLLANGTFQFGFTNLSGASFTVFATTNLAAPFNTWSSLGAVAESPAGSGQYQFTDPQATNNVQRYYHVRSP